MNPIHKLWVTRWLCAGIALAFQIFDYIPSHGPQTQTMNDDVLTNLCCFWTVVISSILIGSDLGFLISWTHLTLNSNQRFQRLSALKECMSVACSMLKINSTVHDLHLATLLGIVLFCFVSRLCWLGGFAKRYQTFDKKCGQCLSNAGNARGWYIHDIFHIA